MLAVEVRRRLGNFALDVAFAAPTPGIVALYGRSGCGKTSTVNLIAGLADPDQGRIALDGEVLADVGRGLFVRAEDRRIGYVFQDGRLFPHLDVRGNLRYGLRRARGAPRISLEQVGSLLGLAELLDRRVAGLSGGERQRVALGRALLSQPRLLLLDEPLAAVDAARREDVLPYLERLRDELRIPMVYVSHQFDEVARLATHVVVLEAGRVAVAGDLTQVAGNPALWRAVGRDAVGVVLEGTVQGSVPPAGPASIDIGEGVVLMGYPPAPAGSAPDPGRARVRVQVLARDVILAVERPGPMSIRNVLPGTIASIEPEDPSTRLVTVDLGPARLLARVTRAAAEELGLKPGLRCWALVKAVSLRDRGGPSG